VHITPLQGTYLAWLDCRAYGLTSEQLVEHIAKHGGVLLNAGTMYGKAGEGFVRMNLATQRARVEQGTQGIIKALSMLEPQN
jgi:cystathionine beta-lyase